MRSGELLSLTWDNVNIERKEIVIDTTLVRVRNRDNYDKDSCAYIYAVHSPKTPSGYRTIPLNKWALYALEILKKEVSVSNKRNLVFSTKDGNFYSERYLADVFDKILKTCNIPHKKLHCLRHTFATQMIREGMNIIALSKILGHTNPIITHNVYIHFLDLDRQSAVFLLDE